MLIAKLNAWDDGTKLTVYDLQLQLSLGNRHATSDIFIHISALLYSTLIASI